MYVVITDFNFEQTLVDNSVIYVELKLQRVCFYQVALSINAQWKPELCSILNSVICVNVLHCTPTPLPNPVNIKPASTQQTLPTKQTTPVQPTPAL